MLQLRSLSLAALSAAALFAGCASSPPPVQLDASARAMFEAMSADADRQKGTAAVFADAAARSELREAELIRRFDDGELTAAADLFYAGAVLVRSSSLERLLVAESLGRRAALLGDERGKPVAAEAEDRQALLRGEPQPYGTQYAFNTILDRWVVYAVDPDTTDEQRAAAGLPDLAWFESRVEALNESGRNDDLKRALTKSWDDR